MRAAFLRSVKPTDLGHVRLFQCPIPHWAMPKEICEVLLLLPSIVMCMQPAPCDVGYRLGSFYVDACSSMVYFWSNCPCHHGKLASRVPWLSSLVEIHASNLEIKAR
jgi:hypothetical protein